MNSEINNHLTLSSVTPVKTDSGSQNNSTSQVATKNQLNQPVKTSQDQQDQQDQKGQVLSLDAVKKAAENSTKLLQDLKLSVHYSVDSETKEYVIKVVDTDTGKLIRQIPSAEMLDFVKRMQDLQAKQTGAVIQTRA